MRSLTLVIALSTVGLACSSDSPTELLPASYIDKLRILAIKAEPPEAAPGENVILSALVADPWTGIRRVGYLWVQCDPSTEGALGNACAQQDTLRSLNPRELPEGVRVFPLFIDFAFYRAPFNSLDGLDVDSIERHRGLTATILLVAWEGGNLEDLQDPDVMRQSQMAIKRIRIVDPQQTPNENPRLASLTLNGAPFDGLDIPEVKAGSTIELSATSTEESVQAFTRILPDGSIEEQVEQNVFSWYTRGGRFTQGLSYSSRTQSGDPIGLELPELETLPNDMLDVWVVLRDARGGTDWAKRRLKLVE